MSRRRWVVIAVVGIAALGGIGGGIGVAVAGGEHVSRSRAATDRPCEREYVEVLATPPAPKAGRRLVEVGEVEQPTALVFRDDGSGDGLLASRTGQVHRVAGGRITDDVVLDLSDDTIQDGDGGLLALAYDPDGEWLYLYRTDTGQDEHVTAYPLDADGLPDPSDPHEILDVDHPRSEQHHGGGFAFGPDGYLYIGLGDGGGLGDPRENAQDLGTLLGKILRIDPTPEGTEPYDVPPGNPFVSRGGARPEIWALGLRNPFRLTFDDHGDLWIGDVGQSCWEEIDRLPAGVGGQNLGWDVREGTHRFEGGHLTGGTATEPEQTYAHRHGWCALVLGYVTDDGGVLHTDYCKGRLYELRPTDGDAAPRLLDTGLRVARPTDVVLGPGGETWILSLEGGVYRVEG